MVGLEQKIVVRFTYILLSLVGISSYSQAQDLGSLNKNNLVKVSGSLNANTTFYRAWGIENRRIPFFYLINGNLNVDVAGIQIPITASVSTQNQEFAVPFNQYGLSPRYKWVTAHLGYRSLRYSNFSLSGTTFLGAGLEVDIPNLPLKVEGMYGRFEKASLEGNSIGLNFGQPTYKRMGFGTKITLGDRKKNIAAFIFRAKDDTTSIVIPDTLGVKPQENLIVGLATKSQLSKRLSLEAEYSLSAYTQDLRHQDLIIEEYTYVNNFGNLFSANATTELAKAIMANLSYRLDRANFKLAYRRVDPGYRTMGAVFLNNDLEDITANVSTSLIQNKLQLAVGGGIQRNNLEEDKVTGTKRLIGSINASYQASEKLSFQLDYSNFNTSIEAVPVYDLDSLEFYQITRTSGLGANYSFGSGLVKHTVFANGNQQDVINSQGSNSQNQSVTVGHQFQVTTLQLSIATTVNYNQFDSEEYFQKALGPGINITKQLFKRKLRTTLGVTYLTSRDQADKLNDIITLRLNGNLRLFKQSSLGLNLSWVDRNQYTANARSFSEFRSSLTYGYTF